MNSVETIKDFMVSLGFNIDESGKNKFDTVLKGVTTNVLKFGVVLEGASLAVVGYTAKIASGLDKVYWASQRTGASVAGIKALGYAASQAGGNAEAAKGSLESLSRFMRNNPGAEGFLNRLGVQTRDAKGQMRDTAAVFTQVGEKLNKMPYYRSKQYADMLGIDENTLQAMRRGLSGFTADYQLMLQKTGFNVDAAAQKSNKFMTSLTGLGNLFGILRDKIGSNVAGGLTGSIDTFKKFILDNFPKIEKAITAVINVIFGLANAFQRLTYRTGEGVNRILKWWDQLDKSTKNIIKIVGALLAGWRLLNTAFLSSPIGLITTLIMSLGLLWEDYQTWKEGGKSLIDWSQWKPEIDAAIKGIKELRNSIFSIGKEIAKLLNINLKSWSLRGDVADLTKHFGEFGKMMTMVGDLLNALKDGNWREVGKIGKALLSQGSENPDAPSAVSDSANSAGDWVKAKTGFDPRSVGQWVQQQFSGDKQTRGKGSELLRGLGGLFSNLEKLYGLPAGLLHGVAKTESNGNPNAMSPVGAKGMFQIMDGTAGDLGLKGRDVFDPVKSANAAAKYLSQLLKANGGDLDKTLASYNWGLGNVQKRGMSLLPKETRDYLPRVKGNMREGASMQVAQQNTYNIYGGSAAEVGSEVERRQVNANAKVLRNAQTRTS